MTLSHRPRPLGVTLIALLFLFEAITALGLAAFLLLSPTGATAYGALFDRLDWPAALSSLLAVPPLLTAALAGMVFRGLWRLTAWARLAALVVSFLFLLLLIAAIAFLAAFAALTSGRIMAAGVGLIISGFAFIYLLRARIDAPAAAAPPAQAAAALPAVAPLAPPLSASPGFVERPPASAPPPAVVGVAGNLVPPPPRPRPGRESGAAAGSSAAALYDSDTLASAPSTQQLAAGSLAAADQSIAWLVVRSGQQLGQSFPLHPSQTLVLGRDPARANVVLSDPTVSGLHAQIRQEHGRFVIYDLGSTNGTFLGGETGYTAAVQRQPLQDGDELRLGSVSLLFTTGKP